MPEFSVQTEATFIPGKLNQSQPELTASSIHPQTLTRHLKMLFVLVQQLYSEGEITMDQRHRLKELIVRVDPSLLIALRQFLEDGSMESMQSAVKKMLFQIQEREGVREVQKINNTPSPIDMKNMGSIIQISPPGVTKLYRMIQCTGFDRLSLGDLRDAFEGVIEDLTVSRSAYRQCVQKLMQICAKITRVPSTLLQGVLCETFNYLKTSGAIKIRGFLAALCLFCRDSVQQKLQFTLKVITAGRGLMVTKGELVCVVRSFCVILQIFLSTNESGSTKQQNFRERHNQRSNNEKQIALWFQLLLNDSGVDRAFAWSIDQLQGWKNNPANLLQSLVGDVWILDNC